MKYKAKNPCDKCKGTGIMKTDNGTAYPVLEQCDKCKGSGKK